MNKITFLLLVSGVSIFFAGCANIEQKPNIKGNTCFDSSKAIPLEIAKANGWEIEKVAAAQFDGDKPLYINTIKIPPEFICK